MASYKAREGGLKDMWVTVWERNQLLLRRKKGTSRIGDCDRAARVPDEYTTAFLSPSRVPSILLTRPRNQMGKLEKKKILQRRRLHVAREEGSEWH